MGKQFHILHSGKKLDIKDKVTCNFDITVYAIKFPGLTLHIVETTKPVKVGIIAHKSARRRQNPI